MKYLSLILLGASLVAGLPGAAKAGKAGKANGAAKANGNANAAKANGNANAAKANGNGQATTAGQGNTNGQTNTGTNTNGQTNTGNTNGQTNTGNTNANGQTNGTPTASAPGNAVSAANVPPGANPFLAVGGANGNSNVQFPQLTDVQKQGLQQAAVLWSQDTAIVSSALSLLGSGTMSDADFRDAADMAYIAEVDELRQKNYIDALIGQMPQLQAATTSLTNGSFAIVVDQLREMRIRGQANQTFVQAAVQGMNNLRCRQVLLAIDAYVLMANQAAGNNTVITATRPPACQQVYAQTADTLPAGAVVNATTFPNAQQLITQFNQPPRFQLSNAVAFSQNSGSDATPALGSQFTAQAPFSNTSSLAGQLLAFNGQPVQTNGDPANAAANPLNAVLFANQVNQNLGNTNGQTNTGTNTNGQTNTGTNTNGQTNTGTNTNGQTNTGTNTNGQTNTGTNTNGQTNTGTNTNGQTNTGSNTNGQTNTGNTNAGTNATGNTKGAGNQAQAGKANGAQAQAGKAGKANGAAAQAGKAGKANGASAQAGKANKANN